MAKSRSESSLRGAEIPRFTRNKLRNLKGFAEGKRTMPGPGKRTIASGGVYLHLVGDKPRPYRNVVEGLVPS